MKDDALFTDAVIPLRPRFSQWNQLDDAALAVFAALAPSVDDADGFSAGDAAEEAYRLAEAFVAVYDRRRMAGGVFTKEAR